VKKFHVLKVLFVLFGGLNPSYVAPIRGKISYFFFKKFDFFHFSIWNPELDSPKRRGMSNTTVCQGLRAL
jgi:hypothetical protein